MGHPWCFHRLAYPLPLWHTWASPSCRARRSSSFRRTLLCRSDTVKLPQAGLKESLHPSGYKDPSNHGGNYLHLRKSFQFAADVHIANVAKFQAKNVRFVFLRALVTFHTRIDLKSLDYE